MNCWSVCYILILLHFIPCALQWNDNLDCSKDTEHLSQQLWFLEGEEGDFISIRVVWGPFTHSVVGSNLKPTLPIYFALVLFPQQDKEEQLKQSVLPTAKGHFCLPWRSRHLQLEEGR